MSKCDIKIDLIVNIGHSYLYFMVQLLCVILKSPWWIYDAMIDLIINVGHDDLYFMDQ